MESKLKLVRNENDGADWKDRILEGSLRKAIPEKREELSRGEGGYPRRQWTDFRHGMLWEIREKQICLRGLGRQETEVIRTGRQCCK